MIAHLIDTHLLVPRSRSSAKVKVKYLSLISRKMAVSGALEFHTHILFYTTTICPFKDKKGTIIAMFNPLSYKF